ncbi:cephalosporin hydroxylase family protein, partial [Paenibacillus polymyxa]|nr:cephalosporin hydroxylase family protein [Paenibacillus polymyxa]
ELSIAWRQMALERKYMNNFSWAGRPLIQLPMDAMAMQELIWAVKPDLIIETGIAHGGSLMLSASMLQLLGAGDVVGVDIEI